MNFGQRMARLKRDREFARDAKAWAIEVEDARVLAETVKPRMNYQARSETWTCSHPLVKSGVYYSAEAAYESVASVLEQWKRVRVII